MGALTPAQRITTIVFGDTFSLYSAEEFEEFVAFLRTRLERNEVDLEEAFAGKRCLDAGCGGGRATIMMAEAGAAKVVAIDLSETNLRTTQMRAQERGVSNVVVQRASLLEVPFADESFDVVWSNGVLHHTGDTDGSLKEITRVLRQGGWMWLYLYGSGGIYWRMVDWVREMLAEVDVSACIAQLRLQNVPVRRIAEWIDDWFVPVLQRYRVQDVRRRLEELGFAGAQALSRGTDYDTSQRRIGASPEELELMGDGDVRFWCQKTAPAGGDSSILPDAPDGKGSRWEDGSAPRRVDEDLERIRAAVEGLESARSDSARVLRVMACGRVHAETRARLEADGPFDLELLRSRLQEIAVLCEEFASLRA